MSNSEDIRNTLFADIPLDAFPRPNETALAHQPWAAFVAAREAAHAGDISQAIRRWQEIATMSNLESRFYAQAWHYLRAYGVVPPPDIAKVLLGVIVEVSLENGLDLLAAYADRSARYFNFSGAAVIWEHPNDSLDPLIDSLLGAGARILQKIGPWGKARPTAPPLGKMRVNLISPAGLHFGQGPMHVLAADPIAKPAIDAATTLMQALIARGNASIT